MGKVLDFSKTRGLHELTGLLHSRYSQVEIALNSLCSTVSCFSLQHLQQLLFMLIEACVLFDPPIQEGAKGREGAEHA